MKQQRSFHGNHRKNSGFAKYCDANRKEYDKKLKICLQICADAAAIAAHDEMEMNPEWVILFLQAFAQKVNEISDLLVSDGNDDPDLVYSTVTLDKAVLNAVGKDYFTPYEQRYS